MNSSSIYVSCLVAMLLVALETEVAAQQGFSTVTAHPGQDVELLCTVTPSESQTVAWIINHVLYTVQRLHNGILTGYSSNRNNLIIQNIMMNDDRNDTEYSCVIVSSTVSNPIPKDIVAESNQTILYVAVITNTTSSVGMTTTTPSEGMTTTTSSKGITTTTSNEGMTTTSSVGMTTTTTTNTSSKDMTTITSNVGMTTASTSGEGGDGTSSVPIVIFVVILIILYCCLVFLFFYCYKKKERHYQDKDFFDAPINSVMKHIILGVLTFGISIVVWYMIVKCRDKDEDDDDKYCSILHASIIVLAIYTFGTSLLLWWLYKKLAKCCCDHVKEDSKEVKRTEVFYAVSPQTLSDEKKHSNEGKCSDEGKRSGEGKQTRVGHDYDYASTGPISRCVPTAGNGQQSTSTKAEQQSSVPLPNASGDATKVKIDEQSSVPYMRTASGARYALSEKSSIIKDNSGDRQSQYANIQQLPAYVNVVKDNSTVDYADVL